MFVVRLNGWAFPYELSSCGINFRCSYLHCVIFRYHVCLEHGVSWHSSNYRVWIYSKTCMWHDKNALLKNFLPLYTALFNYFIKSRVKASYILDGDNSSCAQQELYQSHFYSCDQKRFFSLSNYLLGITKFTRKIMLT